MEQRRIEALERAVRKLERERGWLVRLLLLAVASLGALVLTGASGPYRSGVIEARGLRLVAADGRVLGSWTETPTGGVRLQIGGEELRRVVLDVGVDGETTLNFLDDDQRSRFALGLVEDGSPSLNLRDERGIARLVYGLSVGTAGLEIYDASGALSRRLP